MLTQSNKQNAWKFLKCKVKDIAHDSYLRRFVVVFSSFLLPLFNILEINAEKRQTDPLLNILLT